MGAEVMTDMTDKQIRRAILRVNTGLTEQMLQLNGSYFCLFKNAIGWYISNNEEYLLRRRSICDWRVIPSIEEVRTAIDLLTTERVVDS